MNHYTIRARRLCVLLAAAVIKARREGNEPKAQHYLGRLCKAGPAFCDWQIVRGAIKHLSKGG